MGEKESEGSLGRLSDSMRRRLRRCDAASIYNAHIVNASNRRRGEYYCYVVSREHRDAADIEIEILILT